MTRTGRRLAELARADLRALHREGTLPDLDRLDGVLDGAILNGSFAAPPLKQLRTWRGKVFTREDDGTIRGRNRLGLGPLEVRRLDFTARVAPSRFDDREVVLLDHEGQGNPMVVQRFHDELVQVDDGVFLATSHHRSDLGPDPVVRYLCHFALVTRD